MRRCSGSTSSIGNAATSADSQARRELRTRPPGVQAGGRVRFAAGKKRSTASRPHVLRSLDIGPLCLRSRACRANASVALSVCSIMRPLSRRAKLGVSCGVEVPVGKGLATHPYRVLGPWRSTAARQGERDGLSVDRESCRPQGRSRSLKCWYSFEINLLRMPRVLTDAEGNTEAPGLARVWRSAGVLRPWHAGRDTSENPGSPEGSREEETVDMQLWHTDLEARMGKPGHGTVLEPVAVVGCLGGRVQIALCRRGVLWGIVVRGWESQPHGEGPHGSTQPAKETHAGHGWAGHA